MSVRIFVGGPVRSGRKRPLMATSATTARRYAPELAKRAVGEGEGREEAAERRADELVRRELHGVEAPVGPGEAVGIVDDAGHHRLGGGVEQRLAHAEGEGDQIEDPELLPALGDDHAEETDEQRPGDRHQEHRPAPVEPVGERAGREGEEQPGKAAPPA